MIRNKPLDPAARAIAHIVLVRDEIEQAARIPGSAVTITRQAAEMMLNDLDLAARAICKAEER